MALIMHPGHKLTKVMGHLPGEQAATERTGAKPENLHSRNPTGAIVPGRIFVGNIGFPTSIRGAVGRFGFRAVKRVIVSDEVQT